MKKVFLYLFFLIGMIGHSQSREAESLLKDAIVSMKEQPQYTVDVSFKLYRGLTGTKVYEQYDGIMAKNKQKYYQQIDYIEELTTSNYYIKLSLEDKEMYIGKVSEKFDTTKLHQIPELFSKYFDIENFQDKGSFYTIELIAKKEIASSVAKIYLDISKESKQLLKQTIILGYYADFSVYNSSGKSDPDVARLELKYSNYSNNIDPKVFELDRYFTKYHQQITPGKEFKGFEIYQSR